MIRSLRFRVNDGATYSRAASAKSTCVPESCPEAARHHNNVPSVFTGPVRVWRNLLVIMMAVLQRHLMLASVSGCLERHDHHAAGAFLPLITVAAGPPKPLHARRHRGIAPSVQIRVRVSLMRCAGGSIHRNRRYFFEGLCRARLLDWWGF